MRVLITNNTLAPRAGSELFVRDLAIELMRRGHQPVAFSTTLGAVAQELRNATIPVIDRLECLGAKPDIIHGHHHLEAAIAMLHFPDVPAIHFCHGWTPWEEAPLHSPQIRRYVAVSEVCRERLVAEGGIAPEKVEVIGNFFDERVFLPRCPLPLRPRSALAFGNDFTESGAMPMLRNACSLLGIHFDAAGMYAGGSEANPAERLRGYDLVFAKGRAAIEAMAVGNAVILCNGDKLGPLVTRSNVHALRRLNFGLRAITEPLRTDRVVSEIGRYDAEDATEVSSVIRPECELQGAVDRILALYSVVLDESRSVPRPNCAEVSRAAARYLQTWAPAYKHALNHPDELEYWMQRCTAAEGSLAAVHDERQSLQERCVAAESSRAAWEYRSRKAELALNAIQKSAT